MLIGILILAAVLLLTIVVFAQLFYKLSTGMTELRREIQRSHDSLNHEIRRLKCETKEEREDREDKEVDRRRKAKEEEARRAREREEQIAREAARRELEATQSYASDEDEDYDDGYECRPGGPSCCGRGQGPYYC